MRVFVAGATGAMGRRLVPMLVAGGYEVAAMIRAPQQAAALRAAGAQPVVAAALDRGAVVEAVRRARPEVVIHQLTALAGLQNLKNFDREFALTNRLRTESIDYLLDGARAAGAGRFIAQSYGGWTYGRSGTALKTEDDPLDPAPPANQTRIAGRPSLPGREGGRRRRPGRPGAQVRELLRAGHQHQPGRRHRGHGAQAPTAGHRHRRRGVVFRAHRRRRLGHRGGGPGRPAGVYNIVDDEPARSPTGCPNSPGPCGPGRRAAYRSGSDGPQRVMSASR